MRSKEQMQTLFEQQLFGITPKTQKLTPDQQLNTTNTKDQREQRSEEPRPRKRKKQEDDGAKSQGQVGKSTRRGRRPPRKTDEEDQTSIPISNLYDTKESHPIIEYLPSKEDAESATLTPSFVLEVTWPRIVQFYHPLSQRCQSLQPIYVSVARGIKRRSSRLPVEFHAVNCGVYRDVCETGFNVKSVPAIIGLRSGRIVGTELSLPGSTDGAVGTKKEIAKDVELKVEYLAQEMGIPLDAVKQIRLGDGGVADESEDRIHRMSGADSSIPASEQVFHDARSSLVTTLTSSLYSQLPPGSALPPSAASALAEFLDLIR